MSETLSPPAAPRIVTGAEASKHVGLGTIIRLARHLAESIHDDPRVTLGSIRSGVRTALRNILPTTVTHSIYPYPTDYEMTVTIVHDLHEMLRKQTLVAALVGKSVVGVGGHETVSTTAPVVEVRRIVIDPEFQGRKIFPQIADTALRNVEEQHPDSSIILATRQPSVIRWGSLNGFSEIDWRRFYFDHKEVTISCAEEVTFDERVKRCGWRYFERNPSQVDDGG